MDIVINGGLLFLFAFSTVQTTHQDRPEQIWKEMTDSDLQVIAPTGHALVSISPNPHHPSSSIVAYSIQACNQKHFSTSLGEGSSKTVAPLRPFAWHSPHTEANYVPLLLSVCHC